MIQKLIDSAQRIVVNVSLLKTLAGIMMAIFPAFPGFMAAMSLIDKSNDFYPILVKHFALASALNIVICHVILWDRKL